MKLTKAAMRTRHVRFGQMTVMDTPPPVQTHDREAKPRMYATDRYSRTNNGVPVPQQLRERIEAAMGVTPKAGAIVPFLGSSWGFL